IYTLAAEHASRHGILLADTKFEFGFPIGADGREGAEPILVDEALTPDSSRFWPADRYTPGGPQPSFDKQFLREYLETLVAKGAWGKQAPGPDLPPEVVARTVDKYRRARDLLVGA
ncbi:MAG: phosphoribosylaminoimidazolesuccinocarboxamide synthase, partial [Phycisphaerae bacterium]